MQSAFLLLIFTLTCLASSVGDQSSSSSIGSGTKCVHQNSEDGCDSISVDSDTSHSEDGCDEKPAKGVKMFKEEVFGPQPERRLRQPYKIEPVVLWSYPSPCVYFSAAAIALIIITIVISLISYFGHK